MTVNYYAPFGSGQYWRNITDLTDTAYGQLAIVDGKRRLIVGDKVGELCLVGGKRRYWVEGDEGVIPCGIKKRYLKFMGTTFYGCTSTDGVHGGDEINRWTGGHYAYIDRSVTPEESLGCLYEIRTSNYITYNIFKSAAWYKGSDRKNSGVSISYNCSTGVAMKTISYYTVIGGVETSVCNTTTNVTGDSTYKLLGYGEFPTQLEKYTTSDIFTTNVRYYDNSVWGGWIQIPATSRDFGCGDF